MNGTIASYILSSVWHKASKNVFCFNALYKAQVLHELEDSLRKQLNDF